MDLLKEKKTFELRDYQQKIIDKVMKSNEHEITIDAPMRSGKSLIISELASLQSKDNNVVVLTETSELIDQLDEHLQAVGINANIIKAGKHRTTSSNVHLIMEQSFHKKMRQQFNITNPYIIKDEVHKGKYGDRFKDIINHLKPKKIIGLSATPYDEKLVYIGGEYIKEVTMQELIDRDLIKKPKYFIPTAVKNIDYDSLKDSGNDYNQSQAGKLLSKDDILVELKKLCEDIDIGNRYTLLICSTIDQAEKVYNVVRQVHEGGSLVHSKLPDKHNAEQITKFKNGYLRYLVSISKLAVGFNAPIANTLINLRPTKIMRTWKQFGARHLTANGVDEYGELYDFGNCIQNLGFVEDEVDFALTPEEARFKRRQVKPKHIDAYIEDKLSQSDNIAEISTKGLQLYINEITRQIEEYKQDDGYIDYLSMSPVQLRKLFAFTEDPYEMIRIGNAFNELKYHWHYKEETLQAIGDKMSDVLYKAELIHKKHTFMKAFKTRIRNIVNDGKKLASMIYFPEWFLDNIFEKEPWLRELLEQEEYDEIPI